MPVSRRRVPWILGLLVAAAIPFIPDPPARVERTSDLDVELVRSAQVRFRGITASFDELTRAYALSAYRDAELVSWQAWPHPRSPETEALVQARFRVAGVQPDSTDIGRAAAPLRGRVERTLEVTWRLNTLAAVQVYPHDDYARDALTVYRQTVQGMLGRMVYLLEETDLRDAPGGAVRQRLSAGSVLLREQRRDGWTRVRVPADTTAGWLADEGLRPVHGGGD